MLRVRTELRESDIHGVGVFTLDAVPEEALVWLFQPALDKLFTLEFPQQLNLAEREWFESHATLEHGFWLLDGDNAKYMNHALTPNLRCEGDGALVAARYIYPGEELTCDYREFCEMRRKDPFWGGGQ